MGKGEASRGGSGSQRPGLFGRSGRGNGLNLAPPALPKPAFAWPPLCFLFVMSMTNSNAQDLTAAMAAVRAATAAINEALAGVQAATACVIAATKALAASNSGSETTLPVPPPVAHL